MSARREAMTCRSRLGACVYVCERVQRTFKRQDVAEVVKELLRAVVLLVVEPQVCVLLKANVGVHLPGTATSTSTPPIDETIDRHRQPPSSKTTKQTNARTHIHIHSARAVPSSVAASRGPCGAPRASTSAGSPARPCQ